MAGTSVERQLLEVFYKSVGVELGFYNAKTRKLKPEVTSEGNYQANLETVRQHLANGWTVKELEDKLWELSRGGYRGAVLREFLPSQPPGQKKLEEGSNLVNPEHHPYQHPALYVLRMPTFMVQGDQMLPVSPGQRTAKAEYTLRDLVRYWLQTNGRGETPRAFTQALGYLRYLIGQGYRVDEILHAIDLAAEADPGAPPTRVGDYIEPGCEEVRARMAWVGPEKAPAPED